MFLLKLAVSNLLRNAIEFSDTDSTIKISSKVDDEYVHLIIEDQGPGIPEFALEKIFEKFFSLPRPDSGKKSTGLGLNFVRETAVLHNGSITLVNREHKGVRASLKLPIGKY